MDRFVSRYTHPVDGKGRVSIPAPFRAVLARDGYEGLFASPSVDYPAVDAGGHALVAELTAMVEALPPFSASREECQLALFSESQQITIDKEGRIILPQSLRDHIGAAGEVVFVGAGHKFQLWEPQAFAVQLASSRERLRIHKARAASPGAEEGPFPAPPGASGARD